MSVILYRPLDGGDIQKELFDPDMLHPMLSAGWYLSPNDFPVAEEIESPEEDVLEGIKYEDMENHEIRALAKEAGIENHDDAWIKTLIKKLRALDGSEE
jgi:hypothetical protein